MYLTGRGIVFIRLNPHTCYMKVHVKWLGRNTTPNSKFWLTLGFSCREYENHLIYVLVIVSSRL